MKPARPLAVLAALAVVFAAAAIEPPKPAAPAKQEPAKQEPAQQEPAPAPPPPADAQPQPAGDANESAGGAAQPPAAPPPAADDEELPPLPPDLPAGPSPGRFNPTEKVRADFPVSFPIDI